ncbi:tetratricopeptide repeat protein [Amycolatopsis mediterranei]|uniref:tetratricopeptide repeat protein n=1 Tax=Amycolatopsis mediterranei TaxID=33910 RepID=UPI003439ED42
MGGERSPSNGATSNAVDGEAQTVVQAGTIGGDVHFHASDGYRRASELFEDMALVPLVVPQRKVASDRLHGREALTGSLVDGVRRRATGQDRSVPGVLTLCGMGGTGKTTIALEIAHRVSDFVTLIWWVSVLEPASLIGAMRAVAMNAGASVAEFEHLHPADVLWRRLNALPSPWLLVLDNVDDLDLLAADGHTLADGIGWLREPRTPNGTVIVTSRESRGERWGSWIQCHHVESLSAEDGARVLLDRVPGAGTAHDAELLAANLGGLPLALDIVGSYLASAARAVWPDSDTPTTFADYLSTYADRLADIDAAAGTGDRVSSRRNIATTWDLSLDLLARQGHPPARPLLHLLSWFAAVPLPYQLVLDLEVLRRSSLFADLTERQLKGALHDLVGLQLANLVPGVKRDVSRALELHPVVRSGCRTHLDAAYSALGIDLLVHATSAWDPEDPARWASWRALAPHCAAAIRALPGNTGIDSALVLDMTAVALRSAQYEFTAGLFQDATRTAIKVVEIRGDRLGATHRHTLDASRFLAQALLADGRNKEALARYREVFQLSQGLFAADDPHMLSARRGLGRSMVRCGLLREAKHEFEQLIGVHLAHGWSQAQLEVVQVRRELASVLLTLGDQHQAEAEFRSLVALRRAGADHDLLTLQLRLMLAKAMRENGSLAETERQVRELLDDAMKVYTAEHPMVLAIRHVLAITMRNRGRTGEAEQELRAVGAIARDRLGEEHPTTVVTRHELANILYAARRFEDARAEFEAIGGINKRRLGTHHPDTLTSYHNLGCVLFDMDRVEEALSILRSVTSARIRVLGENHPSTLLSLEIVAEVQRVKEKGSGHGAV